MQKLTNISEAKATLSHLIKVVQETNEPILIGKAGQPIAILSAYKTDSSPRKLGGSWEGNVEISANFDEGNALTDSFYNSSIFPTDE